MWNMLIVWCVFQVNAELRGDSLKEKENGGIVLPDRYLIPGTVSALRTDDYW